MILIGVAKGDTSMPDHEGLIGWRGEVQSKTMQGEATGVILADAGILVSATDSDS